MKTTYKYNTQNNTFIGIHTYTNTIKNIFMYSQTMKAIHTNAVKNLFISQTMKTRHKQYIS
jgi:hypothetical protein